MPEGIVKSGISVLCRLPWLGYRGNINFTDTRKIILRLRKYQFCPLFLMLVHVQVFLSHKVAVI